MFGESELEKKWPPSEARNWKKNANAPKLGAFFPDLRFAFLAFASLLFIKLLFVSLNFIAFPFHCPSLSFHFLHVPLISFELLLFSFRFLSFSFNLLLFSFRFLTLSFHFLSCSSRFPFFPFVPNSMTLQSNWSLETFFDASRRPGAKKEVTNANKKTRPQRLAVGLERKKQRVCGQRSIVIRRPKKGPTNLIASFFFVFFAWPIRHARMPQYSADSFCKTDKRRLAAIKYDR